MYSVFGLHGFYHLFIPLTVNVLAGWRQTAKLLQLWHQPSHVALLENGPTPGCHRPRVFAAAHLLFYCCSAVTPLPRHGEGWWPSSLRPFRRPGRGEGWWPSSLRPFRARLAATSLLFSCCSAVRSQPNRPPERPQRGTPPPLVTAAELPLNSTKARDRSQTGPRKGRRGEGHHPPPAAASQLNSNKTMTREWSQPNRHLDIVTWAPPLLLPKPGLADGVSSGKLW